MNGTEQIEELQFCLLSLNQSSDASVKQLKSLKKKDTTILGLKKAIFLSIIFVE
jgi:thermostable 8-oxoguanine DNA glycosylase